MVPPVPALNFAKLPPPRKVFYPSPKNAAPQAHSGGAHLVHRTWPLPPAPPPKEINAVPKAVASSNPEGKGTGPFWFGAANHKMQNSRHLRSTLVKAIGSDLVRAPILPRSVVFWGNTNQEVREARRQNIVLGMDEGRVRTAGVEQKRETWKPSTDCTSEYFHSGKSTYIRGSAALVKQQFLNERAKGLSLPRPGSAASKHSRDGRRSASTRPSSACSMRSFRSKREQKQQEWWKKNSWDKSLGTDGLRIKTNIFKQRILDDIMQEAAFVRVNDSDACKFAAGRDKLEWTEVQMVKGGNSKKLLPKKGTLKTKAQQPPRPAPWQSSAMCKNIAPHGPNAFSGFDASGGRAVHRTPTPPPMDLEPDLLRSRTRSNVRAIMERASLTLQHIQALKDRQLTEDEVYLMLARDPAVHASPNRYHYRQDSRVEYTPSNMREDNDRIATLSPEDLSPCSLDSGIDQEEMQDTFQFTQGQDQDEVLGGGPNGHHYHGHEQDASGDFDAFHTLSSDEYSMEDIEFGDGGGGEADAVTPKETWVFMPSRPPGYFSQEKEMGVGGKQLSPRYFDEKALQPRYEKSGRGTGGRGGEWCAPEGHYDQIQFCGGFEDLSSSSTSSEEERRRSVTEEDSRVPWGPPQGATDPVTTRRTWSGGGLLQGGEGQRRTNSRSLDVSQKLSLSPQSACHPASQSLSPSAASRGPNFQSMSGPRHEMAVPMTSNSSTNYRRGGTGGGGGRGAWPAAAAGLFDSVKRCNVNLL